MKTKLIDTVKIVIIGSLLAVTVSYASTWVAPTATPPSGNPDAPINIGTTGQTKLGGLSLALGSGVGIGLDVVNGISLFNTTSISSIQNSGTASVAAAGPIDAPEYCDQNGQHCVTLSASSTFTPVPQAPTASSISPSSITASTPTAVTVSGSNFDSDSVVVFNGTPINPSSISSGSLSFTTPSLNPGTYSLNVEESNDTSLSSGFLNLTVTAPTPPAIPSGTVVGGADTTNLHYVSVCTG